MKQRLKEARGEKMRQRGGTDERVGAERRRKRGCGEREKRGGAEQSIKQGRAESDRHRTK